MIRTLQISVVSFLILAGSIQALTFHSEPISHYDVIIIGAGISGTSAANIIKESSHSYLILEGRNRTGGRISSIDFDGALIDIGASWLHQYHENPDHPMRPMVKKYEIEELLIENATEQYKLYDIVKGDHVDEKVEEKGFALCEQFYKKVREVAKVSDRDLSCQEAGKELLEEISQQDPLTQRISYACINEYENDQCSDINKLAAAQVPEVIDRTSQNFLPLGSYGQFVKKMAKGLNIKLNKEVVSIHREKGKVTIKCSDGSIYQCKRLISSLPLGVLKTGKVQFTPALPEKHLRAIQYLGMGTMNKVCLSLQENFWGPYLWMMISKDQRGKFTYSASLSQKGKNIICAFITNDFLDEMKNYSNDEIIDQALETMRKIFGEEKVKFRQGHVTRWQDDPYSYGSYSSFSVGSSKEDTKNLSEAVDGQIWFVGEHVSGQYIGLSHGAWQTGHQAAEKVLESF